MELRLHVLISFHHNLDFFTPDGLIPALVEIGIILTKLYLLNTAVTQLSASNFSSIFIPAVVTNWFTAHIYVSLPFYLPPNQSYWII